MNEILANSQILLWVSMLEARSQIRMQINAYLNEYEFWILNLKIEKNVQYWQTYVSQTRFTFKMM